MAVPSSGQLREYADIGVELGVAQSNVSLRGMSAIAGFSTPDAMSEFYGYSSGVCTSTLDPFGDGSGVALYRFNGNANDESGNFNATFNNPQYTTGVFNSAARFTGSSSSMTATVPINCSNSYTVSGWIKLGGGAGYSCNLLYLANFSAGTNANFIINDTGLLRFRNQGSTEVQYDATSFNNSWIFVACVFDSSAGSGTIYLNGSSVATGAMAGNANPSSTNEIGGWYIYNGVTYYYNTDGLDQLRYFNRALNSTEVSALYNETIC